MSSPAGESLPGPDAVRSDGPGPPDDASGAVVFGPGDDADVDVDVGVGVEYPYPSSVWVMLVWFPSCSVGVGVDVEDVDDVDAGVGVEYPYPPSVWVMFEWFLSCSVGVGVGVCVGVRDGVGIPAPFDAGPVVSAGEKDAAPNTGATTRDTDSTTRTVRPTAVARRDSGSRGLISDPCHPACPGAGRFRRTWDRRS